MNTNKGLVSVITPMYNSSETIIHCIESALNQTYKNIEIIIVNDGSKDNCASLVMDYIEKNSISNITLLEQENQGPSAARNLGIKNAKGEYIAFLDSDDKWLPKKLEEQTEVFQKYHHLAVLGSQFNFYTGAEDYKINEIPFSKLLFKNYLYTSTVICKKDIIMQYLFNQNQKYSEDYRTWLQIAADGHLCMVINVIHTLMNDKPIFGGGGLSARLWLMEKGELSNYMHLFRNSKISFPMLITVSSFSFMKFIRRCIISFGYRLKHHNA